MIATRICKSTKTNKIVWAKVVDENTLQVAIMNTLMLKFYLLKNKGSIVNISDSFTIKQLVPNRKISYFSRVEEGDLMVYRYCIITKTDYNGGFDYIADADGELLYSGHTTSMIDIANNLKIDPTRLVVFNAIVNENEQIQVYYPDKVRILSKPKVAMSSNVLFDSHWKITGMKKVPSVHSDNSGIHVIDNFGVEIDKMKHIPTIKGYVMPSVITAITEFNGGVVQLDLNNISSIGDRCFVKAFDLTYIKTGKLSKISEEAFLGLNSLETVVFTGREKEIGNRAFKDCTELCSDILTSAQVIGSRAFENTSISNLILSNCRIVYSMAFKDCCDLQMVQFASGIERIYEDAFNGCSNLCKYSNGGLELPQSLRFIGNRAFANCPGIKVVYVSINTTIAKNAFDSSVSIVHRTEDTLDNFLEEM